MPDRKRTPRTHAVYAALLAPSVLIAQDEEPFDRTPVECVTTVSIDRTDIIDDQTIIFFMRGKRIFRNYLPRKCPGLAREDRFSYQTTNSRLCDIDTITVLEQFGSRLQPGFTCALGEFHPIAIKEVEAGATAKDVARRMGVSYETMNRWRGKYGGMTVSEAQDKRRLEDENRRLRELVARFALEVESLKAALGKKW